MTNFLPSSRSRLQLRPRRSVVGRRAAEAVQHLFGGGVTMPCSEPAKDIVARIEAARDAASRMETNMMAMAVAEIER